MQKVSGALPPKTPQLIFSLASLVGFFTDSIKIPYFDHWLKQVKFLMWPHPLDNFEIQKYYQHKPKFTGVYSRNNLTKIKHEVYIINLDEHISTGTHWLLCL